MGDEGFRNINIFKNLLELYAMAYREARKIEVFFIPHPIFYTEN